MLLWMQLAWCTRIWKKSRIQRWHGTEWALPALSLQIPFVLLGLILARKTLSLLVWVRAEEQSRFRTKGLKKRHAGLVVSMATQELVEVITLFYRSQLLSLVGKEELSLAHFKIFMSFPVGAQCQGHQSLPVAQPSRADSMGRDRPNEIWWLWGLWAAFGLPIGHRAVFIANSPLLTHEKLDFFCYTLKSH